MFARESVRADQHVHLCFPSSHVMKRAAIRRRGAGTIKLSDNSVWTLLVSEEQPKEIFPLFRSEEDVVVDC